MGLLNDARNFSLHQTNAWARIGTGGAVAADAFEAKILPKAASRWIGSDVKNFHTYVGATTGSAIGSIVPDAAAAQRKHDDPVNYKRRSAGQWLQQSLLGAAGGAAVGGLAGRYGSRAIMGAKFGTSNTVLNPEVMDAASIASNQGFNTAKDVFGRHKIKSTIKR